MLNKKTKNQEKSKIKKRGFERKRREESNKNEKGLMNKNFAIEYLLLFFSWNKSNEERKREKETKTRNKNKAQQERQEGRKKRKKERERETEKVKVKKGGAKEGLWRKKGKHWKINKKMPSLGGKTGSSIKSKERNGTNKKQQKTNKEGVGPSEVASLGHLTWPLSPPKKTQKKQNKNKKNQTAIFVPTKTKSRNSKYHFCLPTFLSFNKERLTFLLKPPIFIVF